MTAVKNRKLSDLYRRGVECFIDDGEGGTVEVWLQKLNPLENETASRNANAARARHLLSLRNHESVEYLALLSDVLDYSREDLIKFLAAQDIGKRAEALEAEFADEKGWNEDDYLQGLNDSWADGLRERFEDQPDDKPDEEAQRCFDELARYQSEFGARLVAEEENLAADMEGKTDDNLREMMVERLLRLQADMTWLLEFRKTELWLGVREPEHHKSRYCTDRFEIDELASEVTTQLIEKYVELNVPVTQGKDSPPTPTSSEPSESPEKLETADTSGPKDAEQ